ncbi:MAG TPA: tetratricopeptide repeat protein [Pirellulaceae bacterium]|nr:tetratricopeptide repeat protein [Pirellulaceae bacterium]
MATPSTLPPHGKNARPVRESTSDELPEAQTVHACLTAAEELAVEGHAREAALLYEKARGLDPQATDYSRRLAGLYDLQGDLARAGTEFRAALAAAPHDADLLNDYGCFLDRQGNYAEAERLLRQALSANPQHERAQVNLGITLAHQGRFQEAFDTFSAVVGPAAAHSNVGMLLARQGRREEALQAFQQALAIDPDVSQARAAVEYLTANLVASQPELAGTTRK